MEINRPLKDVLQPNPVVVFVRIDLKFKNIFLVDVSFKLKKGNISYYFLLCRCIDNDCFSRLHINSGRHIKRKENGLRTTFLFSKQNYINKSVCGPPYQWGRRSSRGWRPPPAGHCQWREDSWRGWWHTATWCTCSWSHWESLWVFPEQQS